MTFRVSVAGQAQELHTHLRAVRERAQRLGRPVLASVARPAPLGKYTPLGVFHSAGASSHRVFWARPERDFWMVGVGRATALISEGGRRFSLVSDAYKRALENAVIDGPDEQGVGPVFMGGFRFDPHAPRSPVWQDFPDAMLVLPKLLFTWSGGRVWITANFLVGETTDITSAAGEAALLQMAGVSPSYSQEASQPLVDHEEHSSPERWAAWVGQALEDIKEKRLTKVVLARQKLLRAQGRFSLGHALEYLVESYPQCSVCAMNNGNSEFLAATPESLVRMARGTLSLTCLAGTASRSRSPEEDQRMGHQLMCSTKERAEHQTVVDMLIETLRPLCEDLSWDSQPSVLLLRNVAHLQTSFTGRVDGDTDLLKLAERLHPTPAVGGTPTDRALETIRTLEGDRGWYAGLLGWLDRHGEGEFGVGIRSALLRGNEATLFAGAGIVEGSDPDREFEETESKFQPLLAALGHYREDD